MEGGKKGKLSLPVPEDYYDMPPKCRVKPPKLSDLPSASKPWRNADLPIDILLLTVEDCEFLSCFSFLDRPFKSYKIQVGPIYFGYTGNTGDQENVKVALMKCSKGAAVPGGSLTAVKNAVKVLNPKAVFSVGMCSGLSSDKVKLGDVVVSAKLTTAAGFKTPVSRHVSDLVRDAPHGWVAPLENPDELEVEVHCDGDILSQTQAAMCDLHLQYPEAIAVETEGEGVFAAAYDEKVEWVVVKGVARFVNQTQLSRSEWMSFASTMAASVVAKMLNDPVVFQEWPHCSQARLRIQIDVEAVTEGSAQEGAGMQVHPQQHQEVVQEETEHFGKKTSQYTQALLNKIADKYLQDVSPSNVEEYNGFMFYLEEMRKVLVVDVKPGCLIVTVEVGSEKILEELWKDYREGHLNEVAQKFLVTEELLVECGLTELKLTIHIAEEEYKACKRYFCDMVKKWKSDEGSTKEKLENMEEMLKQWKSDEGSTKDKVGQVEDMLEKWKSDEGSTKEKLENMEEMVKSEVIEVKEMLTQWKKKEGEAKDNMGGIEGTSNEHLEQANAQETKEGQREGESQLQEFIQRLKQIVISSTAHVTDLQQPFRPNPGEGPPAKDFTVDEIFVNVVIREGRVSYDFPADRWEQLKVYPMASAEQINPLRPQDIFDSRHRNVLADGRPGIGKTLLCTRLLRFWASDDTKIQSQCEVAFLLKFRRLNSEPDLNLRELLTRAEALECLEDELWQYIKDNPSKVLLIFDGLDEFSSTPRIARDDSRFNNTAEVRMPMGCLYKKIASGKLLQGCTLLTTVRPTAVEDVRELQFDRTVEITGFTFEQVEEFVEKFTKDDDSGKLKEIIWQHISTNINLFSLCYIPVNCFIICHCLLQLINISSDAEHKLPVKMTEIYSISVKIFFYKHSRGKYSCAKTDLGCYMYKRFDELQPENDEVFKILGKIAFNGIKSGELVFESHEVSGLEDCGLLHRLPDMKPRKLSQPSRAQYCFTHLTVQEFFAAKHLTDTLPKDKLQRFVADHSRVGTWKVVMQFVAGLLEPGTRQRTTKSEIFTHLLPEKIERSGRSDLIWWLCSYDDKLLALAVYKCLYEFDGEQEKVKIQSKGAEIGFNAVDFSEMEVVPIDCPAVMDFVRDANVISLRIFLNDVRPLGCKEIQYSLKDVNCKLTQLDLGGNNIRDQGAAHLSDALKDVNCKLIQLNLERNNIRSQGAAHLSDALKDVNCKLTQLDLGGNNIGDQGAAHLSDALKDVNCKLTQHNLERNNIRSQGAAHLSDALKDVNCKLTQLDLGGNNIGDQGVAHMRDALKDVNCKLTQLNLGGNNIGDQGAAHLSDALKDVNCKLTQLDLRHNDLGDQGAAHLSDALKDVNCKLTQVNLRGSNLRDQGAAHLSDALKDVNCKLTQLNLGGNNIGDQGAAHLSDALKDVNCKLTQLDLRHNDLGDQGAAHLSDALKDVNCKLTQLDLGGNNLRDQGAAHLSDALKDVNCKLTQLDLGGNNIGDQGVAHMRDALKDVNCKVPQLDLRHNDLGDKGAAHLIDAVKDVNC
ncbi:NLR family CARD domain-containing protein 3-like [Montipora foliosa]|uniref:NLR family CARD domain-containing protein 3-like n=1 Tax=Montipora foliosa TaxID=591990 RepID=UPI0035F214EF